MARFKQELALNKPEDFVQFIMNDYLTKHGFVMSDWKGEPAYRAGDGFVEGYKYLKWSYNGGIFHLEAWLKGSFGKEMDLEGFVAAVVKKSYKSNLMQLMETLKQPLPKQESWDASKEAGDFAKGQPGPIPVKTMDNQTPAIVSLVMGILSIVLGLWIPLVGVILACVGFTMARMGLGSSKAGMAKAGKICSIVGICISAGIWLLNIILNVLMITL